MIKVRTKLFWYVGDTVFFLKKKSLEKSQHFTRCLVYCSYAIWKKKNHKKKILKKNQEIADIVYMWIYNLNCYHPRRNIGLIYIHSLPPPPISRISVYHTFVINNTYNDTAEGQKNHSYCCLLFYLVSILWKLLSWDPMFEKYFAKYLQRKYLSLCLHKPFNRYL